MRSLVVSDLHLGTPSESDVLRRSEALEALVAEIERCDQLVLLGDTLELRGGAARAALDAAAPALAAIGSAAGDRRVVVVPGNHDHRLAAEWIERRRWRGVETPLRPVESWRPARSGLSGALAKALGAGELLMAYPGLWLGPGVWATHGHYLDCHSSVPSLEALAAGAVRRATGGGTDGRVPPDAYEDLLGPIYAFSYEVAQSSRPARRGSGSGGSAEIWRRLRRDGGGLELGRLLVGSVLVPGAVAGLNLARIGEFSSDLSGRAIYHAGLGAMAAVTDRLGIDAEHVVFGHTHRTGPRAGDRDEDGWAQPAGFRLWNCGSWVMNPALVDPGDTTNPYWPGGSVIVEDGAEPRLERLLEAG